MLRLFIPFFICLLLLCSFVKASVILNAVPNASGSVISLRWNMVDYSLVTAYVLLKSNDGVIWQVAAANPVYRNYNSSTILAYNDRVTEKRKFFYRVRVYDRRDNTIAVSNTAIADVPKAVNQIMANERRSNPLNSSRSGGFASWQIYPNTVSDILNISFRRPEKIMGVINVIISDVTGKVVIRFRQASNNKQLHIPVNNLKSGLYFIRIDVLNEHQLNEKFVKQ